MVEKIAQIHVTDAGEFVIHMPSGRVIYTDSWMDMIRTAYDLDRQGITVLLEDGEPAVPKSGLLAWLHRMLDKLLGEPTNER